jgi:hypothetical protein
MAGTDSSVDLVLSSQLGLATSSEAPSSLVDTVTQPAQLHADDQGLVYLPGDEGDTWIRIDLASDQLARGEQLVVVAKTADGQFVDRDGHAGSDVPVENAIVARFSDIENDDGSKMDLTPVQRPDTALTARDKANFILARQNAEHDPSRDAQQSAVADSSSELHYDFYMLSPDGQLSPVVGLQQSSQDNRSVVVSQGDLAISAKLDGNLDDFDQLANEQRLTDLPLVQLTHGETVHLVIAGSAVDVSTAHFVRIDEDPTTGAMSVGGVPYGNTEAFRAAVEANWDPGFAIQDGGAAKFKDEVDWTVAGASGLYAPVLETQSGDIFVLGKANVDGHAHVLTLAENTFGFEDRRADQHSDFDYNDMVIRISRP